MRKILLAAMLLGVVVCSGPRRAAAGTVVLGWNRGFGPPVAVYPYYPPVYQPYVPYGWNVQRNWRDTWQDDGVKLHTYTFPGGATR
jgi:hypothetical protein